MERLRRRLHEALGGVVGGRQAVLGGVVVVRWEEGGG